MSLKWRLKTKNMDKIQFCFYLFFVTYWLCTSWLQDCIVCCVLTVFVQPWTSVTSAVATPWPLWWPVAAASPKFFSQSSSAMRAGCLSAVQFFHRIAQREACGTRQRCPVSHARHGSLQWLVLLRCGRGLPALKADTAACAAEAPCVFPFLPLANSCLSSAVNSHVTRSLCVLCY